MRLAVLLTVGVLLILLVQGGLLDLQGWLEPVFALAERHRASPLGAAVVLAAFVAASLVLVPITLLIAATAAAMGPVLGFIYTLLGCVAAAGATFLIGRALGRRRVQQLAGPRLAAVNRHLGAHGVLAVALLRLVPLAPFTIVNIVVGVSDVRLGDFLLGSALGLLPGIAFATLFGHQLGSWLRHPDARGLVLLLGVLAVALAGGWAVRRWAQKRAGG